MTRSTATNPESSPLVSRYDAALEQTRQRLAQHPLLSRLVSPSTTDREFVWLVLTYSAQAIHATQPVGSWIRRAGRACAQLGLVDVGRKLERHAHAEDGHDELLRRDIQRLVAWWNARGEAPALECSPWLDQPPNRAVLRYLQLHETIVTGGTPYAQIAAELEIERLSTVLLPPLLKAAPRYLGDQAAEALSFFRDHAQLDEGHTAFNRRLLAQLLDERPTALYPLIEAGAAALNRYHEILDSVTAAKDTPLPITDGGRAVGLPEARPPVPLA